MEVLGACQAKLLSCSSSPTAAKANIQLAIAMDPAGPQLQARDRRWLGTQNTQAGTQNTVGTRHTFVGTTNTLPGTENTIPGKNTTGTGNTIPGTGYTQPALEPCQRGNVWSDAALGTSQTLALETFGAWLVGTVATWIIAGPALCCWNLTAGNLRNFPTESICGRLDDF